MGRETGESGLVVAGVNQNHEIHVTRESSRRSVRFLVEVIFSCGKE